MKKLVGIFMAVLMLFSFTACEPSIDKDLEEYKANAKTALESYATEKGEDNYSAENWAEILRIISEGKAEIGAAANKPAVKSVRETAEAEIDEVEPKIDEVEPKEDDEMAEILSQFDLSDLKEYWDGAISDLETASRIAVEVTFRKTSTYPIIELKHFKLKETGIQYSETAIVQYLYQNPSLLDDIHWQTHEFDDFRQTAWIVFEVAPRYGLSLNNILSLIKHLETLDFIKSANPIFPPDTYLDEKLAEKIEKAKGTEAHIGRYFGTYNGVSAVMFNGIYAAEMGSETVAGVTFHYGSSNRIRIFKNDSFYGLSKAYDLGFLEAEDIFFIFYHYCKSL